MMLLRGKYNTRWHSPVVFVGIVLALQLLCACDYARMRDDEALQTYQSALPEMPKKTIPVTGGTEILRTSNPDDLKNPVPLTQESVLMGKERYGFYCIQCHGPEAEGYGTVGQSFAPLPTNLKSPVVQDQSDGMLYYKISLGYNRHPPLAETVSPEHRWAIINYMRSLAQQPRT